MEKVALLCVLIASILTASSRAGLACLYHFSKLLRRCRNEANLLVRRTVTLDLDPNKLSLSDPALVCHLQRQYALCRSRKCCLQDDLARQSSGIACDKLQRLWCIAAERRDPARSGYLMRGRDFGSGLLAALV